MLLISFPYFFFRAAYKARGRTARAWPLPLSSQMSSRSKTRQHTSDTRDCVLVYFSQTHKLKSQCDVFCLVYTHAIPTFNAVLSSTTPLFFSLLQVFTIAPPATTVVIYISRQYNSHQYPCLLYSCHLSHHHRHLAALLNYHHYSHPQHIQHDT